MVRSCSDLWNIPQLLLKVEESFLELAFKLAHVSSSAGSPFPRCPLPQNRRLEDAPPSCPGTVLLFPFEGQRAFCLNDSRLSPQATAWGGDTCSGGRSRLEREVGAWESSPDKWLPPGPGLTPPPPASSPRLSRETSNVYSQLAVSSLVQARHLTHFMALLVLSLLERVTG